MGAAKILGIAGLALSLLGCEQGPPKPLASYIGITPPKNISETIGLDPLTPHELLGASLDSILSSNILHPDVPSQLSSLTFNIYRERHMEEDISGFYSPLGFEVGTSYSHKIPVPMQLNRQVSTHLHEIAHAHWDTLSPESQRDFTQKIKHYFDLYASISKELDSITLEDGQFPNSHSITALCQKMGISLGTFAILKELHHSQDFYLGYYGAHFDNMFFGTEAFAFFFQGDASLKVTAQEIIATGNPLMERLEIGYRLLREQSVKDLKEFKYIPSDLLPFYKGLFNPALMDGTFVESLHHPK